MTDWTTEGEIEGIWEKSREREGRVKLGFRATASFDGGGFLR